MRLVFMGTPGIALPALKALNSRHDVIAVYTQPDACSGRGRVVAGSAVKNEALHLGIPVIQPSGFKNSETVDELRELKPEAIVVVAYGRLLPQSVLEIPRLGCMIIHFSILPLHRGASPVAGSILAGDLFTGVSVMLMDKGMDTGPVLSVCQVPIFDWDTTISLGSRLADISGGVICEVLEAWSRQEIQPRLQDESLATYSGIIRKEDGFICWDEEAGTIWRKSRAYTPWPGIYTTWQGKILKLTEVEPAEYTHCGKPGGVVRLEGNAGMTTGVVTGNGVLGIKKLQMEGKKEVEAADFIRGQRGFIGSILPG